MHVHGKALEAVEAKQKSPFFKYMSTTFFFGKTKLFERFFYHNTLPVGFYLILTYIWSISLCKISQLQESEMRPTGWTFSYVKFIFDLLTLLKSQCNISHILENSLPCNLRATLFQKLGSLKGSSIKKNCISSQKPQHFMIMTTFTIIKKKYLTDRV